MTGTSIPTTVTFDWVPTGPDDSKSCGPAMESQAFRDELYEFTDDFLAYLRNLPDLPDWYRTPVDLLEAARVDLMLQLRPAVRDWLAWRRVVELHADHVDLTVADERRTTLEADLREMTLPCEVRLCRPTNTAMEAVEPRPSALRLAAHRLVDRVEARWLPRHRLPARDSDKTHVLLLDQYANSTEILIPVWKRMSADPRYQCLYLAGRDKVRRVLAEHGIDAPNLRRCGPFVSTGRLRPPQWPELVRRYFADTEARYGVPPPPSVCRSFESHAEYLEEVKLTAIRLERVFERFRPDAFLVSSGLHMPARIGDLLCRKYASTGIHLQHGLYTGNNEYRNLLSEVVCMWGDFHHRRMESNLYSAELLVTGSPKHDELRFKYAAMPQSKRPLIVFYSSRSGSWIIGSRDFERHLETLYVAARALPQVDFVVKLHPAETRVTKQRLAADATRPQNLRVTPDDDAYELLQRCHAAITVSSTIGYEALLFRRPLIILNLTGRECYLPLPTSCMAAYITRSDDLAPAIRRVLAAPQDHVAAADDFWRNDGRSLERILALIERRHPGTTPN